jgi:predicted DNA-binding transcriptional regulator AlpA
MKMNLRELFRKSENAETAEGGVPNEKPSPVDRAMGNLIKMKEATRILKASAPTVRKYARLGHYKEYRFGEKLVFYDKEEILNFILNRCRAAEES